MFKKIMIGLGLAVIGAAIYQHKKEKEFDERIDDITNQTINNIHNMM